MTDDDATDLLSQWQDEADLPEDGYVIFISDGVPTVGDTGDDLDDEVAALSQFADHIHLRRASNRRTSQGRHRRADL